jgi:hypothetical protein
MNIEEAQKLPEHCPACSGELRITQLRCERCDTAVDGWFAHDRLVNLEEPYASVLELFLKVRGNVKEMERMLGLSYPTIRSRIEEALDAAGFSKGHSAEDVKSHRLSVLEQLRLGHISAAEAAIQLKKLKERR